MKRLFLLLLLPCLGLAFLPAPHSDIRIYMIGDSTMADKPGSAKENPERGWGQLLHTFFDEEKVSIHNHAVNGRSSRSFISEGRWDTVLEQLRSGDYVFIQFGHNDQKEYDPARYTNPWTAYRRNLEIFVEQSREKGAYPILLSSIVRRKFNEKGTLIDTHGVYPFVARSVARDLGVPFIDMQLMTEELVIELGPDRSKEVYLWVEPGQSPKFPEGKQDDTHLSLSGATTYAGLVAAEIRKQGIFPLVNHLKK